LRAAWIVGSEVAFVDGALDQCDREHKIASIGLGSLFIRRTWRSPQPVVDLRAQGDHSFALGCALSFILGVGLYGAVYLMPVFLAFVRADDALEIGEVMIITGAAQLVMAPTAVFLERHISTRFLTSVGFACSPSA
jgi:MFS transporter, DHA2 family, multidrug resistance protein